LEETLDESATTPAPRWGFQRGLRRAAMLIAIAIWALLIFYGGMGVGWDEALYRQLYAADDQFLARNARVLSRVGSWVVLVPAALAAAILLAFSRRRRAALLLVIVFGGRLLVEIQKIIVDRDRPGIPQHLEAVHSMSFPSGHAANAMITWVAIALLLPVSFRNRAIAVGIGLALALQAGWSRVALGVHWPSDVLGGWAFATFWLIFCMRLASVRPETDVLAGLPKRGTLRGRPAFLSRRRRNMADNKRADIARDNDDSEIIDRMEDAPSHGGASGGNLQRDIGSRAEEQHDVDGKPGVTRVQDKDKPEQANLPRYNQGNSKLNP
jgi:undecaprenyl-diphosphatase